MANILNIPAFIIRKAFTPPSSDTTPINFSQFIGKTVDVSNYPNAAFKYDFTDTDNDTQLHDSDRVAGTDLTGTGGDLLKYTNVDGTPKSSYAQTLGFGNIRITYKDGSFFDSPANSIRFFALRNGDLIINPLDSMRNNSSLLPQGQWKTVTITSPISNVLQQTTMSSQNDPFPVCFTRGTLIETAKGLVPVENLQKGDLIVTKDHDLQPIRWISSQHMSGQALTKNPKLRPIRIRAGALGHESPNTDLMVSPQHRIVICSEIAQRMFGVDEVLVAATYLQEIDGIEVVTDLADVDYFHFMLDRHEIVFANGAASESLYGGSQALLSVGVQAREEIYTLFPELRNTYPYNAPTKARVFIRGKHARELADRMAKCI